MSKAYNPEEIELKWQKKWEDAHCFEAEASHEKPKFYALIEFPYPSGAGLHVGHPRPFTAMDIICRKKRMQGYNVLNPIGFDAFGLPTENFAIKNHIHPAIVTQQNIKNFTRQLKMLGYGFDWDRVIDTTDPQYYKWTQWIFLQLFKHDLAYKTTMPVNWCTSCKCVLANEEVVEGVCERCGAPVIRKEKSQWMLRITKYADRLIDDLDGVDYIERVKTQQRNWIGRSTGTEVTFKTNTEDDITVYTTRVDTLFGVTYTVISPEHPLLKKWKGIIKNWDEVEAYQAAAARKSDFERGELNKDKTGVRLDGIEVINPATGKVVPMFVSDYVLMGYGTGIVMGVPGHDQRDWDFAKAFGLPIVEVVEGGDITKEAFTLKDDTGIMVNSGFLNGMTVKEAIPAMKKYAVEQGWGHEKVNYKLRDWVFSRQRYWGEPIPLVNCPKCGWVPVPEEELPLVLPQVDSYELTDDGESPLSKMTDWVNTTCPKCGGKGMIRHRKTIKVSIPAGIDNGQTISLRAQGNAGKNGGPAGDLLIVVSVRPHEIFRREGTSVLCEAPITFTQAVLGAELEIPTIDGKVKYTIPEGTQSGTTFRLKGKGIPGLNGRGRGDQYVTVYIETPRNLNREQKEALKKFSESLGEKNYEEHKSFFGKFKL